MQTGWVTTLTRAGRLRSIIAGTALLAASSMIRRPIQPCNGRGRPRSARLSDNRTCRRHGYFNGRARHGISRSQTSGTHGRSAIFGLASGSLTDVGRRKASQRRWRRHRLPSTDPTGHLFRSFAEQTKSDLRALAACIRGSRQTMSHGGRRIDVPLIVGTKDQIAGNGHELAALIPGRPRSISRTETTCWPWATRPTRPALLTSLTNADEPCAGCLRRSLCRFEIVRTCVGDPRGVGRS